MSVTEASKHVTIGSSHNAYEVKELIKNELCENGYTIHDVGCFADYCVSGDCNYTTFVKKVCTDITNTKNNEKSGVSGYQSNKGILVSENPINMAIAANRIKGIRCVYCPDVKTALVGRTFSDVNVISVGVDPDIDIGGIVGTFLNTAFSDGSVYSKNIEILD